MPESLFPPAHPLHPDSYWRPLFAPMPKNGTEEGELAAWELRLEFANEAQQTALRGDLLGARALRSLAAEITPATVRFMAERDRHVTPLYRDERIPGFVAAHITGGRGEVHNPRNQFEPSAFSQIELPPSLQHRFYGEYIKSSTSYSSR